MAGLFPLSRRAVLAGSGASLAALLVGCGERDPRDATPKGRLLETRLGDEGLTLVPAEHALRLPGCSGDTAAWLFRDRPFPVLRSPAGKSVNVTLINRLPEHTSIHWHGVRVRNSMDGVPYLTQRPVEPGGRFQYTFVPPDPGTYFFHPHCNTAAQMGRGMIGVLVVEEPGGELYDDDIVLLLKDWRVAEDGSLLPFVTLDGASHAGSYGTLRTVNAQVAPNIDVPAGADVRLRLVNGDSTRVAEIGIEGAEATVIAIDGQAVEHFVLEGWRLGPAMRIDVALRTPASGEKLTLVDYFAPQPVTLASFVAQGTITRTAPFQPRALRSPNLSEPDLARAQNHEVKLSESAVATIYEEGLAPLVLPDGSRIELLDTLCTGARTLWAIDGKTWPENGHERLPPPLMTFKRGDTVAIEFVNTTPQVHPMHLHGHSFKVLSSTKLKRPVHWADTVLVMPDEHVRVAFIADNPGNWMIHCHIIEHQDTGMMGWFRVT